MHRKAKNEFKVINGLSLILIAMFFIGCLDVRQVSVSDSINDDEIVMIDKIPEEIRNINKNLEDNNLMVSLFEGLVEVTENNKPIPALCLGWKVSSDGIDYEFLLRDDIKWSNGEKIIARDFENFFRLLFSNSNYNFNDDEMYSIYGLEEYKKGMRTFDNVAIKAQGDRILKIRLNKRDDDFLRKLGNPSYGLRNLNEPLDNYKSEYSFINYTGPYLIEKIDGNFILLKENRNYVLERNNSKKVRLTEGEDEEKNFAKYTLGEIDLLSDPAISVFKEGTLKNNISKVSGNNITFMAINSSYGLTKYVDVRKGIYSALNHSLVNSYIIENELGFLDFKEITRDEIENNKIISVENKYENSNELLRISENRARTFFNTVSKGIKKEIKVIARDNFENSNLTQFIADELKRYSINVKINLLSNEQLHEELKKKEFNIYIDNLDQNGSDIKGWVKKTGLEIKDGFSIVSLYRKYDLWCISNKVKKMYIDGNGNIILKYLNI